MGLLRVFTEFMYSIYDEKDFFMPAKVRLPAASTQQAGMLGADLERLATAIGWQPVQADRKQQDQRYADRYGSDPDHLAGLEPLLAGAVSDATGSLVTELWLGPQLLLAAARVSRRQDAGAP